MEAGRSSHAAARALLKLDMLPVTLLSSCPLYGVNNNELTPSNSKQKQTEISQKDSQLSIGITFA